MKNGTTLSPGQLAYWHAAIIKALPHDVTPETVRRWDRDGEGLTEALRSALRPKPIPIAVGAWLSLVLDPNETPESLKTALKPYPYQVSKSALEMLNSLQFAAALKNETRKRLTLAKVTVSELGFPHGGYRFEVFRQARILGLDLCPPQVGPILRIILTYARKNRFLEIAMEPIDAWEGKHAFYLTGESNNRWVLTTNYLGDHQVVHKDQELVFVLSE